MQDKERYQYPYIALFQNVLIMDPREQVPTGNEMEGEQSILNMVKLDHVKGTKILKLRFQKVPIERSLDLFANVAYLDGHLLFLVENVDAKSKKREQNLKVVKLNFKDHFDAEEGGDGPFSDENIKNSVTSHEVRVADFVQGPALLEGHNYLSFIDIGFEIITVNKSLGTEARLV